MRSLLVAGNVLRRVMHDRRTLLLILLTPLLFVLLYGYSFSGDPVELRLAVVNEDNGLASVRTAEIGRVTLEVGLVERFLAALPQGRFRVLQAASPEEATALVEEGEAWAAVSFPAGFSNAVVNEALRAGGVRTATVDGRTVRLLPSDAEVDAGLCLHVDDSNPLVSGAGLVALRSAVDAAVSEDGGGLDAQRIMDVRLLYDGEIRSLDYTAPGIIGFAITLISVMLTAVSIVRERTGGTLTRMLVAPVRSWEIVVGYAVAFSLVAGLQAAELLAVSWGVFGIRVAGGVGPVVLVLVLFVLGLQGLGTLLSMIARNEFQAMQLVLILLIPSIMLGGVFWPPETMPRVIRGIALVLPLTHANVALRRLMLAGRGLASVSLELAVLAGFAAAMLLAGTWAMRRQVRGS